MCHIEHYASNVQKVHKELFLHAVKLAAERLGGSISETIDAPSKKNIEYWEGQEIAVAVKTKDFQEGIGVYFDKNGNVGYLGSHFSEDKIQMVKEEIEKCYNALAAALVLKQMNIKVSAKDSDRSGNIILTGEQT